MKKKALAVPGYQRIEEAADNVGIHRVNLYGWLAKLKIVPEKLGRNSFISDADVERIKQERGKET